ncbi:uncharacterized protein LOC103995568 isoform X2 [Musa acuminata AAA Group]|uniref:uncharacterized protein LOC103995568 isoform X2 n=2 Tax=Musa acuminata AAA Group TaxID=214697 RepID=UPI0031D9A208
MSSVEQHIRRRNCQQANTRNSFYNFSIKEARMTRSSGSSTTSSSDQLSEIMRTLETMLNVMQQLQQERNCGAKTSNQTGLGIKQFKKLSPPCFSGEPDPMVAEQWMMQMEKIFDVLNFSDHQKVSFATFMLEGEAEYWWKTIRRISEIRHEHITWKVFVEKFNEKYFSDYIKEQKELEFLNLVQGNLTVAKYEAKFIELSRFATYITDDESRKAKRFERGLKPAIRSWISVLKLQTYADVVERAMIIEKNIEEIQEIRGKNDKDKFTNKNKRGNESKNGNKRIKTTRFEKEKPPQRTRSCVKCGLNHETSQCFRVIGACFACGKLDHKVKYCPLNEKKEPLPPISSTRTRVSVIAEQDFKASKSMVEENGYIQSCSSC